MKVLLLETELDPSGAAIADKTFTYDARDLCSAKIMWQPLPHLLRRGSPPTARENTRGEALQVPASAALSPEEAGGADE